MRSLPSEITVDSSSPRRGLAILAATLSLVACGSPGDAPSLTEDDRIEGENGLGRAIAVSANTALVAGSTSALSFDLIDGVWSRKTLVSPFFVRGPGDIGIAISGDTALLATRGERTAAVDLLVRSEGQWNKTDDFTRYDGPGPGAFAIEADTIFVSGGESSIYQRSGSEWSEVEHPSIFGFQAALADGVLLVLLGRKISSHVAADGWELEETLSVGFEETPIAASCSDDASCALAFDGRTLVIGDNNLEESRVFRRDDEARWIEEAILTAVDVPYPVTFGNSVSFGASAAVLGDNILIGAPATDREKGVSNGSAYWYRRVDGAWQLEAKLVPSDSRIGDSFGTAVALTNGAALVGAPATHTLYHYALPISDEESGGTSGCSAGTGSTPPATMLLLSCFLLIGLGRARVSATVLTLGAIAAFAPRLAHAETTELQPGEIKLEGDGLAPKSFGFSVAIEGDLALIGAPANATSKSAYLFERSGDTWQLAARLTHGYYATDNDGFGEALAIAGDQALVSAPRNRGGAVFAFSKRDGTWSLDTRVIPSVALANGGFGRSLAYSDGSLLVGAKAGAYVFTSDSERWSQDALLVPSDAEFENGVVALSGDTAIIGNAFGGDAVYVFTRSGGSWTQETRLCVQSKGAFGASLALSGDRVLIGAPGEDIVYSFLGADGSWIQEASITPSARTRNEVFGASLALRDDTALIGAYWLESPGRSSGSVHAFVLESGEWREHGILRASDAKMGGRFGLSIALSETEALIGDNFANQGAAYLYSRNQGGFACTSEPELPTPLPEDWQELVRSENDESIVACDGKALPTGEGPYAVSGDTVLLSGPAWVSVLTCRNSEWKLQADLRGQNTLYDRFPVALSGDTALLGDPNMNVVVVMERRGNAWTQAGLVRPYNPSPIPWAEGFGAGVAISGDTILVGSRGFSYDYFGAPSSPGSVSVFRRGEESWEFEAQFFADTPADTDRFGSSVALAGDTALIGSPGDNTPWEKAGSAYVFVRDETSTWRKEARLQASDGDVFEAFGSSVSVANGVAAIGSPTVDPLLGSGAIYLFEKDEQGWSQQAKLTANDQDNVTRFGKHVVILFGTLVLAAADASHYVFRKADSAGGGFGCNVTASRDTPLAGLLLVVLAAFLGRRRTTNPRHGPAMLLAVLGLLSSCRGGTSDASDGGLIDAAQVGRVDANAPGVDADRPPTTACNPITQAGCALDQKCAQLLPAANPPAITTCVPAGNRLEGESCTAGASGYDDCAAGLHCQDNVCTTICDYGPPDSCRSASESFDEGLHCSGFFDSGFGLCAPACAPTDDTVQAGIATNTDCGPDHGCRLDTVSIKTQCSAVSAPAQARTQNNQCLDTSNGSCNFKECASGFAALLHNKPVNADGTVCARFCTPINTHLASSTAAAGLDGKCETSALALLGGTNGNTSEHQCRFIQSFYSNTGNVPAELGICVPTTVGTESWGDCELLDWDGIKAAWNGAVMAGNDPDDAFDAFCLDNPSDPANATALPRCLGFFKGCLSLQEKQDGLLTP